MNCTSCVAQQESGSALVIALILVLVSTLMGVSAMQVSEEENKLVNNEKYRQVAFRAAEAASKQLFTLDNLITLANAPTSTVSSTTSVDSRVTVNAQIQTLGDGPATGYSLGGRNGFVSMNFATRASARIDAVDSVSQIFQGVQRLTLAADR